MANRLYHVRIQGGVSIAIDVAGCLTKTRVFGVRLPCIRELPYVDMVHRRTSQFDGSPLSKQA